MQRLFGFLALCALAGAAPASDFAERDPWQGANRAIFSFNDRLDRYVAQPVARGYRKVTPRFVDTAFTAFFHNLDDVGNSANFALQGEGANAAAALGRVVGNTLLGFGGLIDVAAAAGVPRRDTDFGTTLGKWGVGSGPYLVLPVLGPSSLRDAPAKVVDLAFNPLPEPLTLLDEEAARHALEALELVDMRADLLDFEQAVIGERYIFIRDAWLQSRDYEVNGAPAQDPFLDDESFEEDTGGQGDGGVSLPAGEPPGDEPRADE